MILGWCLTWSLRQINVKKANVTLLEYREVCKPLCQIGQFNIESQICVVFPVSTLLALGNLESKACQFLSDQIYWRKFVFYFKLFTHIITLIIISEQWPFGRWNACVRLPTFSSRTLAMPSMTSSSILPLSIFWDMAAYRVCTVWLNDAWSPVTINTGHLGQAVYWNQSTMDTVIALIQDEM